MEINKFHALQLFTDTFAAETVHLNNSKVGIYIRLLCFAWTKNTKPFNSESAYRICYCQNDDCKKEVDEVLSEFFIFNESENNWSHKRLMQEHEYLTNKYKVRSEAGKKGGLAKRDFATSKIKAPIPSPKPKPNSSIYDPLFEDLWQSLLVKRGSKYKAFQLWQKLGSDLPSSEKIILIYNSQIKIIEDTKFIPHFSTWLSQRRWESDNHEEFMIPELIARLEKIGYKHIGSDGNFEKFSKDGKSYRIDRYDEKHQMQLEQ